MKLTYRTMIEMRTTMLQEPSRELVPLIQALIMALPLWHGVELMRQLSVGYVNAATVGHVAYFLVMTVVGITVVTLRLRKIFLR